MTSKEIQDFFKSQTRVVSNNSRKCRGKVRLTYETIEDILTFLTPTTQKVAYATQTRRGNVILRKRG